MKFWLAPGFLMAAISIGAAASKAQMVTPDIDRQQGPFSYFSKSTDMIGVMNAPGATEITPEGFLYTGFGELMFFTGPEQTPLSARVRTLEKGYLPILHYGTTELGIDYRFTAFSAQIPEPLRKDTDPTGQIVNFVRVAMSNPGTTRRAAFLTTALRYQGEQTTAEPLPDNRFRRPVEPDRVGDYRQLGERFKPDWAYSVTPQGACLREDRVLYRFPTEPQPQLALTLRTHYNRIQALTSDQLTLTPTTPVCRVQYTILLAPGETRSIDLVMPLVPAQKDSADADHLAHADFDTALRGVVAFWEQELARGMQIRLPESKTTDTFKASLVYDLMSRGLIDGKSVQTAGQFQYHRFYLRDAADYVRMYDVTGYADIGGQVLDFFLERQQPDGNFLSQPNQYDGWGEAMWTLGEHFRMTHDMEYARRVYPDLVKAVDWLHGARAKDPLHLIPATDVRDNEYVSGHLTGYNFLALDGLQAAIDMAKALGKKDDQARFEAEMTDYRSVFFPLLEKVSRQQGGALPPSLDAGEWKGTDWGNLLSVTPEPLLDPWDARVTATLKKTQAHYQEGISTYAEPDDGVFLHHYLTIKNTLTELVRGEQEQAMREFYAILLHTSSTHTGFEYAIRPWGNRDFLGNLAPHEWFAADYRNLLRNMMLREEGDRLHLFSALSPEWIGAGKSIQISNAPSAFGKMDFSLESTDEGHAVVQLQSSFTHPPAEIVLHIPWFLQVTQAVADGRAIVPQKDGLHLPAATREVRIQWNPVTKPQMNYQRTVDSFKTEYSRRWDRLMTEGKMSEGADTWQVPE